MALRLVLLEDMSLRNPTLRGFGKVGVPLAHVDWGAIMLR